MTKFEESFFVKFPSALFVFLPFTLITGPFLSDLSITLISLIYIFYCLKFKYFTFFKNKYFLIFFSFCILITLNSLISNYNFSSFKSSFFYFRFGIFVGAVIFLLEKKPQLLEQLFYIFILCFSALIIDSFIQYFYGKNILGWAPVHEKHRISSFFGSELILGSYLSRFLPIIFALAIFLKKKNNSYIYIAAILLVFTEIIVFLSGERTAFAYVNLSAIFIIIMIKNYKLLRFYTFSLAIVLIIIISIFNESAKKRIIDLTLKQFNFSKKLDNKDDKIYIFSKQHNEHYISAIKMFKENIFFGVGVKNFRNLCSDKKYYVSVLSCSTHPHNTYIQFLSETGLIGFFYIFSFFVFFCFMCLKHIYCLIKRKILFNDFEVCLLAAILISIWPFAPTGSFFNNWLSIVYYMPVGILIWSRKLKLSP